MRPQSLHAALGVATLVLFAAQAAAQPASPPRQAAPPDPAAIFGGATPGTEFGIATWETQCSSCHGNPTIERAPSPDAIRMMPPERIYTPLTTGVMQAQGAAMTDVQKRGVAEFMSGRPLGSANAGAAASMPN